MKELHLKYKMETGDSRPIIEAFNSPSRNAREIEVASDSYLEWLEDLAEKYLKQQKINADANKVMAKFEDIKLVFNSLKNEIGRVEEGEVIDDYLYNDLNNSCDQLEDLIYD